MILALLVLLGKFLVRGLQALNRVRLGRYELPISLVFVLQRRVFILQVLHSLCQDLKDMKDVG